MANKPVARPIAPPPLDEYRRWVMAYARERSTPGASADPAAAYLRAVDGTASYPEACERVEKFIARSRFGADFERACKLIGAARKRYDAQLLVCVEADVNLELARASGHVGWANGALAILEKGLTGIDADGPIDGGPTDAEVATMSLDQLIEVHSRGRTR